MKLSRPQISEYQDAVSYLAEMLQFRKKTESSFSVANACQRLRRVSPTLISLILQKKRRITTDRVHELAKLMNLNATEKKYFLHWIEGTNKSHQEIASFFPENKNTKRKDAHISILSDWINIYVKDLFQIPEFQDNPDLIYKALASVASPQRIDKSIRFLLSEGYLKTAINGKLVVDTELVVADPRISSDKIRKFHKGALLLAKQAIDVVPPNKRLANSLIIPLNDESYEGLLEIIDEFTEKLKDFAERPAQSGDQLYQLIINLSPVGGSQ
ncbi:MAG: TIGR02147 family protein [Bdellovibrionales bacterium]|nr:TIGR02147 family protein [Bdellovibrionales bacterium]